MNTTAMANETADYNDLLPGRWVLVMGSALGRVVRVSGDSVTVKIDRAHHTVKRSEVET